MAVVPANIGRAIAVVITMAAAAVPGRLAARQAADIPVVRLEGGIDRQPNQPRPFPVTRLDDGQRGADLDAMPAVSLTFAAPLPVRDVLLLLFRGTPFSIVFDATVNGTFTGELQDLTLRQALESVLFPSGLDYALKGRVVRVFPRRPETRLFMVSHLDMKRAWQRRVRSGDDGNLAAELTASVETDFFQQLADGVRMLLSSSGRVHVDRTAGVVQVTDFADRLDQVGVYVEAVTLRASRQVRLRARVLEVSLVSPVSIDWNAVGARAGVTIGTGAGVKVADFNALLQAIGSFGRVHEIASPQFVAMNNEPAYMRVGSDTAVFVEAGDREPAARLSTTSGLTLSITSQIGADGVVHMSVSPTWTGGRGHGEHVELDTTMRVKEGETVVISGLLRDSAARVAAGGLPGVFDSNQTTTRSELVILLTPTIVTAASPPAGAQ